MCDTASARIGITATASRTAASIPLYRTNAIISPFQERNPKASPNAKVNATASIIKARETVRTTTHLAKRYTYISVVEKLPAQLIEENAAAGVTKLALLAKLGPQDREEVAGDLANLADTIVAQDKAINAKADTSDLEAAAANASAWITGNKGGYVVLRRNADGQPYELLIMDKPTIEEATKVWRFNSLDCDVCYRDYPAIMEKNGLNGYTKTAQAAQPKATEYMVTAGPMSAGDKNTIKAQAEALGLPVTVKEC